MIYSIVLFLSWPIRFALKLFSPASTRKLVVQTAKIGDYINSTCVFDALYSNGHKFDVVIDKTNENLARYDERIEYVYLLNNFRKNLFRKAKLAQLLFAKRYSEVIVLLPNQFNLFLGAFCTPNYNATIRTYGFGLSNKILSIAYSRLINHESNDLTLDSYSKCIKHYDGVPYKKSLKLSNFSCYEIQNEKNLKIAGVSLSAGAKWKNLPIDEWQWVFSQLVQNNFLIAVIGIGDDEIKLKQILAKRDFRIMNLINKVSLEQLPELISRFSLFVSSDSGPAYIADAVGVPTLVYAGPCHMVEQRPVGKVLIVNPSTEPARKSYIFDTIKHGDYTDCYSTNEKIRRDIINFLTVL